MPVCTMVFMAAAGPATRAVAPALTRPANAEISQRKPGRRC
jgi:hypothetical protein